MYTSTVQSSPASANAALSPHPHLQNSYPPSAHSISSPSSPHHRPLLLAFLLRLLPPLLPLTLSGFFNGMLEVFEPGALNYSTFFRPILLILSAFRSPILTDFPRSGFLDSLLCVLIAPTPGLAFSSDTTHASGGVVIFVRQGLSFFELFTSSLSSLDPYFDYVGINISLNNSSSVSFLNVYAPPIRFSPTDSRTDSFSPFFSPPEFSSFWGTSIAITPSGTQELFPTPAGKKYSTGSSPLTSSPINDPDTPPFYIALLLTSPLPPSTLALSCSWEVLQDLGFDHLPILLSIPLSRVFRPIERPPSFNFQKACWDGFASYIDTHCPSAEEYSSLSFAAALFTTLALNAAKFSIPFGRIKRPPKAWWSAEVEQAVSERRKAYISASRRASSVIAKAKTEAWQTTCSSLSPKSNPKSVHSLLRSIAGSPSSSSSPSPNFPNCSSPRESASVYTNYLRSHFSVSQPEATSLSSAEPRALWSLTRPFALLSLSRNFLRLPPTSLLLPPLVQTKLPIPC